MFTSGAVLLVLPVVSFHVASFLSSLHDRSMKPFASTGPSIAVVDDGGYLLYFVRPEESFAAGANVSIGKARTSAIFKKPIKDFEDTINKGRFTMTALPDFTPLQGGLPIIHNGPVIGAIGCGGAKSAAQDEEVAKAGAAVFESKDKNS
jgi:uncharacterized protein GlcG (DUF336 family)